MKSWIAKYGEVKLFELCEQDRLDEEELDIIHKGYMNMRKKVRRMRYDL